MRFTFLLVIVLFLFALQTFSQSNVRVTEQTKTTPNQIKPEPSTELASLPPGFTGHFPDEILLKLNAKKSKFKKSEFETTAQYNARIEKEKAVPLMGSLTMQSLFAFSFSKLSVQYDADQSMLTVGIEQQSVFDNDYDESNVEFTGLLWDSLEKRLGSYIGSNAFGVKKRIQAWRDTEIIVGITKKFISSIDSSNPIACSFSVDAQYAKTLKNTVRLLVIGKLTKPYMGQYEYEDTATITNPTHVITKSFMIYIQPVAIRVYDIQTGKVFCRLAVTEPTTVASKPVAPIPPTIPLPTSETAPIQPKPQAVTAALRPTIIYRDRAPYTPQAKENKVQGTVVLSILYGADGTISDIQVVRGLPDGLNESAIAAAKRIRFQPAMQNGKPVSVRGDISYNFTLY